MLKEAMQFLLSVGNVRTEQIGDQMFSTQPLHKVVQSRPAALTVNSLSGLVEYLQSKFDGDTPTMVHVISPTEVIAFSTFNRDFARNEFIKAEAMLPTFQFDSWYDTESFNIKLQSCFVKNEDRDIMLKVVGNIKEESVNTYGDDGVSQSVTAKVGVATVASVAVPNPVLLQPYRTFVEVEQPDSDFVFRMKDGPRCALFEADGGAWKLEAMQNVKAYLSHALAPQIKEGKVVVIA